MKQRIYILSLFLLIVQQMIYAQSQWITVDDGNANQPNTWIAFRKDIVLEKKASAAICQIAADSKYWLWINGELVVFEGGLKRGPNPNDSYYDELDLATYLKKGTNQIAVLLWYFGKEGFSHKDSGQSGLLFQLDVNGKKEVSDATWISRIHPAFDTASDPAPNWRLPESNIRFWAEKDIEGWQTASFEQLHGFKSSKEVGEWGSAPWNELVKRPIPFWKDYGIKEVAFVKQTSESEIIYVASLPYNMQMTPIVEVLDSKGGNKLFIETDHVRGGSDINIRAEYVTAEGTHKYESLGWQNGEKIIIRHAKDAPVKIQSICYRETGYDTYPEGRFYCDDDFYMRFWDKALRTLYVNMRDTYFDCPDRERAQWWGDVVVLMGESFYTYSTSAHALMKKAIHELVGWQRNDGTLFSPIPAGNYKDELPAQMLAAIGHYGFWTYFMHTGDKETIAHVYPSIKKYLGVWELDDSGLTIFRSGGWSWGDWGNHIDIRLLLAAWHYLALKSTAQMADMLGFPDDAIAYRQMMAKIKHAYNLCWNGYAYRHPQYQKETDDRVQALAVISGIAEREKYPQIYDLFKSQWHASPYMEKYVMEALFMMGQGEYAMQRTKRRFAPMVNDGNHTTLFEDWREGGSGGGSTNHAWSGGALTVIAQYLCGIEPLEPGYRVFKVEPSPALFKEASISVPSVRGTIKSAFKDTAETFELHVTVPENAVAVVYLPFDKGHKALVNGKKPTKSVLTVPTKWQKEGKQSYRLSKGEYLISVCKE